ncbi:hypothetical protein IWZ03DRAFT_165323 [Phyllosticta citriasiana]|uniref:Uncharacterized protein n=1 Tax=Phyllosticta citriasiana TaxID=595635 RepID=A0ABR1KV46_9PEZI
MGSIQAPVVNGRSYSYAGPLLACICTWPDSPAATSGQARDHDAWSPDSLRGPRRWFGGDTESTNEGCSHPALQPSRVTTNRLLLMMRLGLAKGWQGRFARSTGAVGVEGNTPPDTTALPLIWHETLLPSSVVGLGSFSLFVLFLFFFFFLLFCLHGREEAAATERVAKPNYTRGSGFSALLLPLELFLSSRCLRGLGPFCGPVCHAHRLCCELSSHQAIAHCVGRGA